MSFRIERSHIVFKHLIHVGPDIDAESIADFAIRRDYSKNERQIPTPQGPLKEYLFRPKTNPQSLIVFSKKGFVIDAQPSDNVLPLFRDAYDFYEKVLGDDAMTATVMMEINGQFEIYSPTPVNDFLGKVYNEKGSNVTFGSKNLNPYGITFANGSPRFPEEFLQINAQPLAKDPERRLMVITIYRSTELDDALKLIEKIDSNIIKCLESISKL
ncbi:MAG: hypothetical protein FK734_01515 [Asgard group archaeon]|nr:hypothetical protein [Asgard group archaeon]